MKTPSRLVVSILFLCMFTVVLTVKASARQRSGKNDFVPGEVIVKFKDTSHFNFSKRAGRRFPLDVSEMFRGVEAVKRIDGFHGVYRIVFGAPVDVGHICKQLKKMSDVEYAEPNYLGNFCDTVPDDPKFPLQWYLYNEGQSGGTPGIDIDALRAWDIETGKDSIVVAVIDTGVDYNHPDLSGNIWHNPGELPDDGVDNDGNGYVDDVIGWDFVSVPSYWAADDEDAGPEDNDPLDRAGHGTYCAGAISAVGNNGIGISGVTWNCKIMPVRIGFRRSDGSSYFLTADAARGIRYAADNGADVINLSWVIWSAPEVVSDAIKYAYSKGIVVVGAVGNSDSRGAGFPSDMPEVISVAATDNNDARALWLLPQPPMPGEGSNYGLGIDIAAPGVEVITTTLDSQYIEVTGTSISTAITSGLAALILSRHSDFTPDEVRHILCSSSNPEINSDKYIGYGRINAYRALLLNDIPVAEISSPSDGDMLGGTVVIKGSAEGHDSVFERYTLQYGSGVYPREWTTIVESSEPVENGVLGSWNTAELDDGMYTLKLTVYDVDGNYNIIKRVVFVNKDIHEGWPVKVEDDIVAHPIVSDIDKDSVKEVIVGSKNGYLYVFKSTGELKFEKFLDGRILTSPALADLDSDGYPEIIVASDNEFSGPPSKVYVFRRDGTYFSGWPKEIEEGNCLAISTGDLDGDGNIEIVGSTLRNYTAQKSIVYVWNADGSIYGNGEWPKEIDLDYPPNVGTAQDYSSQPVLADLDGDGSLEIIVSVPVYEKSTLFVWNDDGSNFAGWPIDTGDGYTVHAVVGDVDGNGEPEIVGVKGNGIINIWESDGTAYNSSVWPKDIFGALSDPVLADLDGDGDLEIITQSNSGYVYIYNHNGSFLNGWPIAVDTPVGSEEWAPLDVGDVDGDGQPEIVASGGSNKAVYVWHVDGTVLEGWPKILPDSSYTSPVIADIDGDGKVEILSTYEKSCVLWDLPGNYYKSTIEWPLYQHDASHGGKYCSFCRADLDNDGDVDGSDLELFAIGKDAYLEMTLFASAFGHVGLAIYP